MIAARKGGARRGRGGFVLGFVLLMLFAISVMGATAYLVVNSEFSMSRHASESAEALAVARAGLHRFVAEQIGVVGDSVEYAIGDGTVLVTTQKLAELDSINDLYIIRSEATVADPFAADIPTARVVEGHAIHRRRPLAHHAAVVTTSDRLRVAYWSSTYPGIVDGDDETNPSMCSGGGAGKITGGIGLTTVEEWSSYPGDLDGDPDGETWSTYSAVYDSIGLRWDVLTDPSFPVDFENTMPDFSSLPADSFPVIRYTGTYPYFSDAHDGRGVLIVNNRYRASAYFDWDGIILAGSVYYYMYGEIHGMFVGGLNGENPDDIVHWGETRYNSCNVYAANESLSYMELLENTVYEVN